ncbi:hypothetical protein GCM10011351_03500 [Paraliobacillus quinghaiensis]|uniref:Uncharacterized protein n=2 Tax=Paraliobacillus quinghaiensis TaxID=470815 RepID=A0A917THH5_9BACI|nr:hypothetical protein GCM10011351_03500 [Paraliobacillus quinghaiensis]
MNKTIKKQTLEHSNLKVILACTKITLKGNGGNSMEFWIMTGGGIIAIGASVWYYASLGKSISKEEKEVGKDLSYETNPYTGSSKSKK